MKTLKEYYKSKHWKEFRKNITDASNCKCEICGRFRWSFYKIGPNKGKRKNKPDIRISIHHKHYNSLYHEKRDDVMALCTLCHDTMHALHTLSNIAPDIYKDVYVDINNKTGWEHEKRSKSE